MENEVKERRKEKKRDGEWGKGKEKYGEWGKGKEKRKEMKNGVKEIRKGTR